MRFIFGVFSIMTLSFAIKTHQQVTSTLDATPTQLSQQVSTLNIVDNKRNIVNTHPPTAPPAQSNPLSTTQDSGQQNCQPGYMEGVMKRVGELMSGVMEPNAQNPIMQSMLQGLGALTGVGG